jgi:hypothetical protein
MLRFKIIWVGIYAGFPERVNFAAPLKEEFTEFFHGGDSTFHN